MNGRFSDYLYIALTLVLTIYGQLALKWRIRDVGPLPAEVLDKVRFLVLLVFDPVIFSTFVAAFLASLAWMAAMTQFELSFAYPFMSLAFVIVMILSLFLFREAPAWNKIVGTLIIMAGLYVITR